MSGYTRREFTQVGAHRKPCPPKWLWFTRQDTFRHSISSGQLWSSCLLTNSFVYPLRIQLRLISNKIIHSGCSRWKIILIGCFCPEIAYSQLNVLSIFALWTCIIYDDVKFHKFNWYDSEDYYFTLFFNSIESSFPPTFTLKITSPFATRENVR